MLLEAVGRSLRMPDHRGVTQVAAGRVTLAGTLPHPNTVRVDRSTLAMTTDPKAPPPLGDHLQGHQVPARIRSC